MIIDLQSHFSSEMLGAVKGLDPETGHYFDDTKRYFDQVTALSEESRCKIFEGHARPVYPRLDALLKGRERSSRSARAPSPPNRETLR